MCSLPGEYQVKGDRIYLMGIFGVTVKNFEVVMSPSQEINRNWEKVIKFPQVGIALKRSIKVKH